MRICDLVTAYHTADGLMQHFKASKTISINRWNFYPLILQY